MPTTIGSRLVSYHHRLAGAGGSELAGVLGPLLPPAALRGLARKRVRRRVYTPLHTFWAFLAQVLSPGQSCREAVRRVQARRARKSAAPISFRTGGYCQARRRLPLPAISHLWSTVAVELATGVPASRLWYGLRVGVVDGTGVSMPDTPGNQRAWPQQRTQKPGCGFPVMKLVAVFSLATGALHGIGTGSLRRSEYALLQVLWPCVQSNFDVLLGDRGFGSFAAFCELRRRNLHGVFRLHHGRRVDWRRGQRLGKDDRLVEWRRPPKLPPTCRLASLPEALTIRIIRVQVPYPGFRTQVLLLSTDLLDHRRYPPSAFAELYLERWRVEVFFAHIKTSMRMDVLRCQTPPMVRRELHMHLVAYNAIRALMCEAERRSGVSLSRISFKGSCDALRVFAPQLAACAHIPALYRRVACLLLDTLAADLVPLRRPRSEPRAVKRRPKNYHLLTKPRHEMGNLPHRNRPNNRR